MGWSVRPAASCMRCCWARWLQCAMLAAAIVAASGFVPVNVHHLDSEVRRRQVSCRSRARGGTDAGVVTGKPLSNALSRLLLGSRSDVQQAWRREWGTPQRSETEDGITLRTLTQEELADTGEHSKLDAVAKLCTRGMFGDENAEGSCWVLKNFRVKYGEDSRLGRQSVMVVAETSDGTVIGCIGMELMLLTGDGMAWWNNPCSVIKKRPFVSDLVVSETYRQRGLGRRLLIKCHEIVTADWAGEIRKLTPAERLDYDIDRIFLKVDAENTAAVNLYRRLGYKEVVKVSEELMVPKSSTDVQEWPVLNVYMQRDAQSFNPFRAFPKRG